jgi:hypothetical protein
MVSAVNTGSLNMPKMLRHLSHRTSQVRDLVFVRDAINRKEVMTTKDVNKDGTRTDNLAGPSVSFGYETNSSAQQDAGINLAYHVSSPELVLPGLKAIQSPITSRSGQHARSGHRITGECKFYMPSLEYIRALPEFSETSQFDELETYDKLIDIERIIGIVPDDTQTNHERLSGDVTFKGSTAESDLVPGYEIDRFRTNIKITSGTLELFKIYAGETASVDEVGLNWDFRTSAGGSGVVTIGDSVYRTIDMPLMIDGRAVVAGDTATIYVDGTAHTAVAAGSSNDGILELNKMLGASNSEIQRFQVETAPASSMSATIEMKDTIYYKAAEWRIESIKDYRDEYMEVRAVRVRGDRTSRRRAYG